MDETETRLLEPELFRDKYPDSKRKNMPASAFCGPGKSFPVTDAEDVIHAAQRLHNATGSQASIKACVTGKAKKNGWPLPSTWTDGDGKDRAMTTEEDTYMYVPITRIDKEKWEVEGQATDDLTDSYKTFFEFDSSKRAFQAWRGNIREMHDSTKAVGRAIKIEEDGDNHAINMRVRVSKGAPDTWQKVLDGTLSGFSIGIPKDKYKVKMVERNGQSIPMYYDYELAEVSLVDNPGNPRCNIAVVRADGVATEVLDAAEETPPADDVTRAGARISHATQSDLHGLRDGHLQGLAKAIAICVCDECMALSAILDADQDGDIDVVDSLDMDGDGGQQSMTQQGMNYALASSIERQMQPFVTRVQAMLSRYAQQFPKVTELSPAVEFSAEPIERRIADVERAFDTRLTEVHDLLRSVKELTERIAAQPAPGGPVMTPVDKRLATSPQPTYDPQNDIAALTRASQLVPFSQEDQIALAAEIIKRQNRG